MYEAEKEMAAAEAVKLINNGDVVGLGTGSTAYFAIKEIANLVKNGMQLKGVPTSEQSKKLAEEMGIPLINMNEVTKINITIDGADEFTPGRQLIKGGGGALLREKVVACLTDNEIIIADAGKQVEKLGKFKVPVEVIPFASTYILEELKKINGIGTIRKNNNSFFTTDQGNYIIDVDFGLIDDPAALAATLDTITGIAEHGLFINLAHQIIMSSKNGIQVFK